MTKTRRQSKAASSPADQTIILEIPDDVDEELLSELLPSHSIDSPTGETVLALYRALQDRILSERSIQEDYDEARAEIERKDVELDQALQDKEQLAKEGEASLGAVRKELEQAKRERDELAASQESLKTQITTLSSSQSSSSTEVSTLKQTVEDTIREKRELVGVISRLKEEASQRDEEIQTLRSNLKEARQEHQALEAQIRELRSTDTSTKFKLETISQQLELAQGEAQRNAEELSKKLEEFTKYRRDKHQELIELQAKCDTAAQGLAACQSTLKTLQSSYSSQSHQLTQSLSELQDLKGKLAEKENLYSSEIAGLNRLVAMMEEREKQSKEVVESLERDWSTIGEKAERREAALQEEIEKEKAARERAETRVEQLETVLDGMGRGDLPIPANGILSISGTPGTPNVFNDGMSGLSPTVAIASRAQKSGKSFTEVYADYVKLQQEFARKSSEYDHMERTLSSVLAQIEERAPMLSQQRAEYERLKAEATQLASELAQAIKDREAQQLLTQENAQKLTKCTKENQFLQQQLEDLGRQVQSLLKEIARRDDPTIPSDADLEQMNIPAENIEAVITNNLVLFKNIDGLQHQNQNLLKIVRELGDKMEAEESELRQTLEKEQAEAVQEAHEAIQEMAEQLERQKKSHQIATQSYMKERDALKSMLARHGIQHPTTNGETISNGNADVPHSNLAKELADVQSQFDVYKTEMNVDSAKLRDEVIAAQREVGQLNSTLAKANAKIDFLTERHRMSQEQMAMHAQEINDLTKRNEQLILQYTRVEVECHRALEDLQAANLRVEQLRTETANLRAEKKIWESVQARLVEENRNLSIERSHLSDLMGNVQKMHNDLELSGQNERRRLESQLSMLESQTQDLRNQITQERDSVRHTILQKDLEVKELQARAEKTTQDLFAARESLVRAETNVVHLESRVNELNRQLQGNEEKLAVYERRVSTGDPAPLSEGSPGSAQQLETEVAELRAALKVAQVDLETARGHIQQFKDISEASESALSALNVTYDEYKADTEARIAGLQSDVQALEQKLSSSEDELRQLRTTLSEAQKAHETDRVSWANDKKTLEDTIVDLSTSEKQTESDRLTREEAVKAQEERAKAAEERYSREVLAHAESIKAVENLKQQVSSLQKSEREHAAQASAANNKLALSESSWKSQREALEKELNDLNTRCRDLVAQNTILHQHLESVSSQAAKIREAVDARAPSEGDSDSANADTRVNDLQSIVNYLRKEKSIVDLQLDMSKTEIARLKTQIEHLSQTLQETRETLSQEREKAVESAAADAQHAELVERINQLNILRESNATLRAESEQSSKKARDLEVKLARLSAELDPTKEAARVAQGELEAKNQQLKRLEEENIKWQERNAQLLSKYDRIDPAEVQGYKDEIERLKGEVTRLESLISEKDETLTKVNAELSSIKERWKDNLVKFKTSITNVREEKKATEEKLQTLTKEYETLVEKTNSSGAADADRDKVQQTLITERDGLTKERDALQAERTIVLAERDALVLERDQLKAEKEALTAARDAALAAQPAEIVVTNDAEAQAAWDKEKADITTARDEATAQVQERQAKLEALEKNFINLRTQHANLLKKFREEQQARKEEREKLQKEKEAAVAEAKSQAPSSGDASAAPSAEATAAHQAELKALEEKLAAKENELKVAQAAASTKPVGDSKEAQEAAVKSAVEELEKKHAEDVEKAVERGRMEAGTKMKIKETQLAKAQAKVKSLEEKILAWREAKLIPAEDPPISAPTTSTASTAASKAGASSLPAKPATGTTSATAPTTGTGAAKPTAAPVRKPVTRSTAEGAPAAAPSTGAAPTRGAAPRGRGAVRGGGVGRGGGPAAAAAAAAASSTTPGGVSIMGAAKRPREEAASSPTEGALAKRIKPSEGAAATATAPKPPPKINRPPPEPSA